MANASNLNISLKITADQAEAAKGLIDLKAKLSQLTAEVAAAQQKSGGLKAEWDSVSKKADSLAIQIALAKKALADLAEQGVGKSHAEYQKLAGEIKGMEADLKRLIPTVKSAEADTPVTAIGPGSTDEATPGQSALWLPESFPRSLDGIPAPQPSPVTDASAVSSVRKSLGSGIALPMPGPDIIAMRNPLAP